MSACRSHAHKVRYPSRPMALASMARVQQYTTERGKRGPVRAYRCEHCGGWFLTSWERA